LFAWLVRTINSKLANFDDKRGGRFIGVLDIFGFENFKVGPTCLIANLYLLFAPEQLF
jgi:hypothetical protein